MRSLGASVTSLTGRSMGATSNGFHRQHVCMRSHFPRTSLPTRTSTHSSTSARPLTHLAMKRWRLRGREHAGCEPPKGLALSMPKLPLIVDGGNTVPSVLTATTSCRPITGRAEPPSHTRQMRKQCPSRRRVNTGPDLAAAFGRHSRSYASMRDQETC
jgi:hypothetical protein